MMCSKAYCSLGSGSVNPLPVAQRTHALTYAGVELTWAAGGRELESHVHHANALNTKSEYPPDKNLITLSPWVIVELRSPNQPF